VTLFGGNRKLDDGSALLIPSVERALASANCGLHDRDGNVELKAATSDSHTVSANLIIRNFRHVYRQFRRLTLTHLRTLSTGRFGSAHSAGKLTQFKGFVTEPAA
jgi:hypothetical protein